MDARVNPSPVGLVGRGCGTGSGKGRVQRRHRARCGGGRDAVGCGGVRAQPRMVGRAPATASPRGAPSNRRQGSGLRGRCRAGWRCVARPPSRHLRLRPDRAARRRRRAPTHHGAPCARGAAAGRLCPAATAQSGGVALGNDRRDPCVRRAPRRNPASRSYARRGGVRIGWGRRGVWALAVGPARPRRDSAPTAGAPSTRSRAPARPAAVRGSHPPHIAIPYRCAPTRTRGCGRVARDGRAARAGGRPASRRGPGGGRRLAAGRPGGWRGGRG